MAKRDDDAAGVEQSAERAALLERRRVIRNRFIGAAIVFGIAFALWQLGQPRYPGDSGLTATLSFAGAPSAPQVAAQVEAPTLQAVEDGAAAVSEAAAADEAGDTAADEVAAALAGEPKPAAEKSYEEVVASEESPQAETVTPKAAPTMQAVEGGDGAKSAAVAGKIAKPGAPPKPKAQAAASDYRFAVQVGAFGQQERAARAVQQIKSAGFEVRIEPVQRGGAELFRVRVVGYDDRAAAEKARQELTRLGYGGAQVIDLR